MKQFFYAIILCAVIFSSCAHKIDDKPSGAEQSASVQEQFLDALSANDVDAVRRLLRTGRVDITRDVPAAGARRAMPIVIYAVEKNLSRSIIEEVMDAYMDSLEYITDRDGNNVLYYARIRNRPDVILLYTAHETAVSNAKNMQ